MRLFSGSGFPITSARRWQAAGIWALAAVVTGGIMQAAPSAPVRLVAVTVQDAGVWIDTSEPAAYTVSRPDPQTVVVDLRGVQLHDLAPAAPHGVVTAVRYERAQAADGVAVVRVRIALARPVEHRAQSARNRIRIELGTPGTAPAGLRPPPGTARYVTPPATPVGEPAAAPAAEPAAALPVTIDSIRTARKGSSTIVTIAADGRLPSPGVTETREHPRRVILDFPNVGTRAAAQTPGDGELVRRVRVAVNGQQPPVARVVLELGENATYAVPRGGASRDLAVVVEPARRAAAGSSRGADEAAFALLGAETITLAQAMANGASLAPPDGGIEAMAALHTLDPSPAGPARPPSPPPPPAASLRTRQAAEARQGTAGDGAMAALQAAPPAGAPAAGQGGAPPPVSPVLQGPGPAGSGQQGQEISIGQEKKYTGHPISMDFQGVDLRSVLRTFAEISGLNMVIDPDVQGTVDIVLTDVPWDQALEVILRGNALDYTVDGTIVRIARIETLRREQDARTQLAQSAANAGALAVRTFTLSYAKAEQAAPLVRSTVLSQRGQVQIDPRTNTLIITDLPARLDTAAQLLSTLDRAEPQVEIEARIITTTREFARALGVQWGFNGRVNSDIGNTTGLAFPNNGSLGGRTGAIQGPGNSDVRAGSLDAAGTAVNLAVPAATSAVGLALGSINGAFNLDVALSALERSGKTRILSSPRVTTQNNVEAEIMQGVQIPVQTEANNTVTVTFKDAALTLKVTPQITAANTVIMQITLENASPGDLVNNIPSIDTQRAITRVQVSDGMTTVMGGIFVSREQATKDATPMLHRVPLLGWLFKRDSQIDANRELLIFITPRILKG